MDKNDVKILFFLEAMNSKRQVMEKTWSRLLVTWRKFTLPFALNVTLNLKIYATGHSSIQKIAIAPCVPRFFLRVSVAYLQLFHL